MMIDYSEEEINNYPIIKELDNYLDSFDVCNDISEQALNNLDELINQNRIDLTFFPKEEMEDDYSICFEIAEDNYDGGATQCFLNVTSELFNKMLERYAK